MALRFRKRIRIAPGIKINITQKGITSATIGPRGLNVNVGKKGKYLNAGLPGTGIYSRTRISAGEKPAPSEQRTHRAPDQHSNIRPTEKEPGLSEGLIAISLIAFLVIVAIYVF
ncbi:DUF4236 domain-containing protein [Xinfangfangia sp. D13-10-4-6]|uniref:DUF4236 domain-containing protein n=1 Tax=Pseudogemmobacter hezensis TaxID=2737662 RepID=UPI001551F6C8|nr:DUF4236 domain-containing protein [Pseudogemmobacter hezensis]NPD17602.1 DUF4236 domain-containing protein [Pseudogemmobacter hezensis]